MWLIFGVLFIQRLAMAEELGDIEGGIWTQILGQYGNRTRPREDHTSWHDKTLVDFGYQPVSILSINQRKQQLEMATTLTLYWTDTRLKWNWFNSSGLRYTYVPLKQIWHPTIAHYRSSDGNYRLGQVWTEDIHVYVTFKGNVHWSFGQTLKSSCTFDVTYFPLDSQICEQSFQPFPQPSGVNLTVAKRKIAIENRWRKFTQDAEWELLDFEMEERTLDAMAAWLDPDTEVLVKIYLRRRYQYYIYSLLIPSSMLSFLVICVFLIPPDAGEKISFGITLLLTFAVFQMSIDSSLPTTSTSAPVVSSFLIQQQILSAISILSSIWVLNLHHLGPALSSEMPRTLHFIIFSILARVSCYTKVLKLVPPRQKNNKTRHIDSKLMLNLEAVNHTADENNINTIKMIPGGETAQTLLSELRRITQHLDKISEKMKDNDEAGRIELEWKLGALVLDRVLAFVCSLVVFFTVLAFFLRVKPWSY